VNTTTSIVCIDPCVDPLWDALVGQAESSVFHSPRWIRTLSDTYGWVISANLLLDQEGKPRAGIAFCRIDDLFGKRIVSLPFSDYCDPLVTDPGAWNLLLDVLLPEHCPITMRCLRNGIPLSDQRLSVAKQAKWHGVDLRPELDALWLGLHDSCRRAIKKSQREGVRIRLAQSEDDLRMFFDLHLKVRKYKYGLLAQPFRFFQNIWRHFVEAHQGFLLLAEVQEKVVAGDFFLVWKDTLYYKFNASDPDELSHRPNDLLTWVGIERAKAQGLAFLDFGLSDWDQEGLARYKRKFGAEEKTISFLQHSPNGGPGRAEKDLRDLLNRLTQRFTDRTVPDPITEKAGEDLYRLFT